MIFDVEGFGGGEGSSADLFSGVEEDFWRHGEQPGVPDLRVEESTNVRGYSGEVIESVWEYAQSIPGTDSALWRLDEFGNWIYRFDYGRRRSQYGWEIFDPGTGRHSEGVFAMRPLHWREYIHQRCELV